MPHKDLVAHLFRHEYGKIMAVLTNKFGTAHLENIEDAVQDALLKAMKIWAFKTTPDNPTAWILRVASNTLIDVLRKKSKHAPFEAVAYGDATATKPEEPALESTISDDQLKMIFACCHPSISREYQIILTLKLVGGFNNKEIAGALLKKEEAVAKAFTRAKKKLKAQLRTINIPVEMGLKSRLYVVLKIIYLLFSEGYATKSGAFIIKKDICFEAIRLALLLTKNKYCNQPEVHALLALMCFHASRFDARVDSQLQLVDLEHQDRSKYDRELIAIGVEHFELSAQSDAFLSDYHLQAAISYHHCIAPTYHDTQWKEILNLYDMQLRKVYSPVVALNRIIAYSKVAGPGNALTELKAFEKKPDFTENTLFYATKAMLLTQLNDRENAIAALEKAIGLCGNQMEKAHLMKKKNRMEASVSSVE